MAGEQFLHGVEVIEIDDGPRPIRTVRSSVIGIVGTAPDADPLAFPINTPVLIAGSRLTASKLDVSLAQTKRGTLPGALDLILDQIGAAVVVVRVEDGAAGAGQAAATLANVLGGAVNGAYQGVHALLAAQTAVGVTPRILIAPGFTSARAADSANPGQFLANPVVAELIGIAERLRAVIVADGPSTTDAAAVDYAGDFGSKRVYVVDPAVKVQRGANIVVEPASSAVAGLIAKIDNDRGFWWSPSNQNINGIVGVARPIDFGLGDPNSRANFLNEAKVATIIREDGYRLWGNRTLSSDEKFAFLSVVRTADIINDSILRAHLWAVDRNITKTYVDDVEESVNAYGRTLVAQGAIAGMRCFADPDLNSPASIAQGKVWFNVDFSPYYPAEHVIFRSRITNDYLEDIV